MIILIEGPDGSGKSTIAEILKSKGFEYLHASRDGKFKSTNEYYRWLIPYLRECKEESKDVVLDRNYISNLIYTWKFQDSDKISLENISLMQDLIDEIVFCLPEKDAYIHCFDTLRKSRGELYRDLSDMSSIYDLFALHLPSLSKDIPVVSYDYERVSLEETLLWVETNVLGYTYGAELEVADWDRSITIPSSLGVIDKNDLTVMNNDGSAVNPRDPLQARGGEINTVVNTSPDALAENIVSIFSLLKDYTINHSCWLHIHVGLGERKLSLPKMKDILKKVHKANKWIPLTPLTPIKEMDIPGKVTLDEESMDYLIARNVTRSYRFTEEVYERAMASTTEEEFWECFKGKRTLVNLQSLLLRGTVEFRFFYMTDSYSILKRDIEFCKMFIDYLLYDTPITLYESYGTPYKIDMDKEKIFRKTKPKNNEVRYDNVTGLPMKNF